MSLSYVDNVHVVDVVAERRNPLLRVGDARDERREDQAHGVDVVGQRPDGVLNNLREDLGHVAAVQWLVRVNLAVSEQEILKAGIVVRAGMHL